MIEFTFLPEGWIAACSHSSIIICAPTRVFYTHGAELVCALAREWLQLTHTHTKASHVVNNLKIYVNKYIYGHPAARNMRSLKYYCARDKHKKLHVYFCNIFIQPLARTRTRLNFLLNSSELFKCILCC